MLFHPETLEAIAAGAVTVAFRRWRRPTVRAGGTLLTPVGVLGIDAVDPIDADGIAGADASAAGQASRDDVLAMLASEGVLYRVRFHLAGPDPRIALRQQAALSPDDEPESFAPSDFAPSDLPPSDLPPSDLPPSDLEPSAFPAGPFDESPVPLFPSLRA